MLGGALVQITILTKFSRGRRDGKSLSIRRHITSFSWTCEVCSGHCANQDRETFSQPTSGHRFRTTAGPCIVVLSPNATWTTRVNQWPDCTLQLPAHLARPNRVLAITVLSNRRGLQRCGGGPPPQYSQLHCCTTMTFRHCGEGSRTLQPCLPLLNTRDR